MNVVKRSMYSSFVLGIRLYQRLFMRVRIWGRERIPTGPKIFVANHISAFDGLWIMPVFPEPVRYVVGPPYALRPLAPVFNAFDQINAMPAHRATVVDEAVKRLRAGKSIFINPEGDFHEQFNMGRFYPGVAKMYRKFRVPIIPVALVTPVRYLREYPFPTVVDGRVYRCVASLRGPFLINVGDPLFPICPDNGTDSEKNEDIMLQIKRRVGELVDEVRFEKVWK